MSANAAVAVAGIVGSGQSYADSRLAAQRSIAGYVDEKMGGLEYLFYIRTLVKRIDEDWEGVKADLQAIRSALLSSKGALVNMTGDGSLLNTVHPLVDNFLAALPATPTGATTEPWSGELARENEAILVTTQVNYVCKAANLYEDAGYEMHGSAYVVNKHLGMSHIWDKVRVVGGAYGGFGSFDPQSGMYSFQSYRCASRHISCQLVCLLIYKWMSMLLLMSVMRPVASGLLSAPSVSTFRCSCMHK